MEQRPDHPQKSQITYINGLGFIPETPKQIEHKNIIMQYNILLFGILLLFFLRMVSEVPIIHLLEFLGANIVVNPMTGLISMSETAKQLVDILAMLVYYGIPILIILLYNRRETSAISLFRQPNPNTTRYGVLILGSISVIAYFLADFFTRLLESGGILIARPVQQLPTDLSAFVLYFFSVTLLPAFLEELLFRGAVLRAMRKYGDVVAIIVSTFLYILVQPSLDQMIYAAILGLALAYFTLKSGSLWTAIVGNFIVKSFSVMQEMIGIYFPASTSEKCFYLIALFLLVIGMIATALFIRNDSHAFQIYSADTLLTNRNKVKLFYSNLGLWMVIILACLNIIREVQLIG